MSTPLVSVIIPAYNTGPYLAETLETVLRQTYPYREVIVVDDGSTENLLAGLDRYRSVISYIRQDNTGNGAATNTGLRAARGEYIALLDHDDLWLPEKLQTQVQIAARHPESGLIACDGVQFSGETVIAPSLFCGPLASRLAATADGELTGLFYRDLVRSITISCPSQTLIPRHVVERIGPLTTVRGEAVDYDYYLRIARRYPITLHRHALIRWRYLPSSMSGPWERRELVWTLTQTAVLTRQLSNCAPADRPFIRDRLLRLVHQSAREAYYYGHRHDMPYARAYLARLARHYPTDRVVLMFLCALHMPSAIRRVLAWCRRASQPSRSVVPRVFLPVLALLGASAV